MMKFSIIAVLVTLFLSLLGCDEKVSGTENTTEASATQSQELTPEEQFAKVLKEAESGNSEAQYNLGLKYESGKGVPKDIAKAVEWYQKAAEQGDGAARFTLISMVDGDGVPKYAINAVEWYRKAAEQGDAQAQYHLGSTYADGFSVPKDAVKAVEWYQKAAEQGNADAQFYLGKMYVEGDGIPKNAAKAVEWFQKAAEQGNADAQLHLGKMYVEGDGIPKNAAKAAEWFQKVAEQGYAEAQFYLGAMYADGAGVPKDFVKAVNWYQKAATQGRADAQYNLGLMYYFGSGVPKDTAKAVEWFQKAAEQGIDRAQNRLGTMYYSGDGVPKDTAKAIEWYQKAAEQGIDRAQFYLGKMYFKGDGVNKDRVIAYAWLNLAAAQDYAEAKSYRDIVEKSLSKIELIDGQRLASNWKKGDNLTASANPLNIDLPNAKPSKQITGTAFVVSSEGHALTNHHVINGCTEIKVAGQEGVAKVVTSDSVNDLALLQLPGKTDNIAKLNPDTGKIRQGEDIIVFGYPLNAVLSSGGNLTPGTVSAMTGLGNNSNQIQITAPIQPGSSGSPVMDKKGNLVAVVSMKLDDGKMAQATGQVGQNVNFAVNGQTVKTFLDANKIAYKTGGGFFSSEKSNADIADEARKWTVLVECWK